MDIEKGKEVVDPGEKMLPAKEILMEFPHPRFNAQLTVQDDILYIYGGTFEKGDIEFTFDEMYAIDLGKLDGVKQIFRREVENWLGSDDEEDSEDDGEDEDDSDEEDEEGDVKMVDEKPLYTESTRKSKRKEKAAMVNDENAGETSPAPAFDDTPDGKLQTPFSLCSYTTYISS
jgi:hypothetical protein